MSAVSRVPRALRMLRTLIMSCLLCGTCVGCSGGSISPATVVLNSVTGYVYSQATGAPIRGALVEVESTSKVTDEDGWFAITGARVPRDVFTVKVSAPGHYLASQQFASYSGVYYEFLVELLGSPSGPGSSSVAGRLALFNPWPAPGATWSSLSSLSSSSFPSLSPSRSAKPFSLARPFSSVRPSNPSSSPAPGEECRDRIVVVLNSYMDCFRVQYILRNMGATELHASRRLELLVVEPPQGTDPDDFLDRIEAIDGVRYAHFDRELKALGAVTSDPYLPQQWYLPAGGFPQLWRWKVPTRSVIVLDTGICPSHPDLSSDWISGWDYVDNDYDPFDAPPPGKASHGTAVYSVIAALADNGEGIAGAMAPLAGPRASVDRVLGPDGVGWDSLVADALFDAVGHVGSIVNMSLGRPGTASRILDEAIRAAAGSCILVAAAGDDGGAVLCPANHECVIAVTGFDRQGRIAGYCNTGPEVFCSAPGGSSSGYGTGVGSDGILAAHCVGDSAGGCLPGGYAYWGGTSMACALAGAAFSYLPYTGGSWETRNDRLKDYFIDPEGGGRNDLYGYGWINAFAMGMDIRFAYRDNESPLPIAVALVDDQRMPTRVVSAVCRPSQDGSFTVSGALPGRSYLFAWIDTDSDGMFSDPDYILAPLVPVDVPASGCVQAPTPLPMRLWEVLMHAADRRGLEAMPTELVREISQAASVPEGGGRITLKSMTRKGGK